MISRLRYRSFKDLDLRERRSYLYVFPLAVIAVAVWTHPEVTILLLTGGYLLSGPVGYVWGGLRRGHRRVAEREPEAGRSAEVLDGRSVR
jgi:CDP-diacylglycerol--serine O-phosphatidyltransferase